MTRPPIRRCDAPVAPARIRATRWLAMTELKVRPLAGVRGGGVRPSQTAKRQALGLFELEGLVLALVVDGRAPDLVRGLVLGAAVAEGCPEAQVEIARVLERIDQLFSI